MAESITLKWGTLKGWDGITSERSKELLRKYHDEPVSMGVMTQRDSQNQKQILLELIDSIDGEIHNDWSGEIMSKDEAKKYILKYGE